MATKTIHIKQVKNDSPHKDMFHVYEGNEMVDWLSSDDDAGVVGRAILNAMKRVLGGSEAPGTGSGGS